MTRYFISPRLRTVTQTARSHTLLDEREGLLPVPLRYNPADLVFRLAQDTGLVSCVPGYNLHTKLYANESPFTATVARNTVCIDLRAAWKKDCASWYAAVSGMKFRVCPRRRRIEGAFYGVITFQRKRNFVESRSSRQRTRRHPPGSQRYIFRSFFPPLIKKKKKKY